jgi:hypothetical protein
MSGKIINAHPEHAIINVPLAKLLLNRIGPTRVTVTPSACPLMTTPRVAKLKENFALVFTRGLYFNDLVD